ncbi:uncharacterized protein LOC117583526 [Drosophila guanche]|uniref:BESS domain-containing protein n=1 Tax=Drosophila guanche TaxID=7266 RepID=A0A3B0JF83_DROGU|nr:uncharacterized protein LOC117583526 [Drosophila guanche]SPP81044.1 Hypothetical predicted protein [Drosophila guanche]
MKIYKQKLRDAWLQMPEFRPWLRRDPEDSYRAHCRFCKCGVNTKICDLRAHARTMKHRKRNSEPVIEVKPAAHLADAEDAIEISICTSNISSPKVRSKPPTVKREKIRKVKEDEKSQPIDYEQILQNLALYEPEQVMFSTCPLTGPEHNPEEEDETVVAATDTTIDEDMINKAVANAVNNQKDSSQIFGDFVADRLRQLSSDASEFAKDKIMKAILEAASIDRSVSYT